MTLHVEVLLINSCRSVICEQQNENFIHTPSPVIVRYLSVIAQGILCWY